MAEFQGETDRAGSARFRLQLASGLGQWTVVVGTAAAVFLGQLISVQLWIPPTGVATIWIHGGLLLAVVILSQPRQWPGLLVAGLIGQSLALWFFASTTPVQSLTLSFLTAGNTLAVAVTLRSILKKPVTLGSLKEFLLFLSLAVVGGALSASLLFLAAVWALSIRPPSFQVWRTFGLAALLGYLTVTPTLVFLVQEVDRIRRDTALRRVEAGILVLLLILISGIVFHETTNRSLAWPIFAVSFPPLLIWAALRFHGLGASGSLVLVTLISTLGTARGLGPFVSDSFEANTLSLQLFILGTGLPLLALAVVFGEQRHTLSALESTQEQLREYNRDLTAAREEEATRIARELHDDVGQRLALVSIGLSRLKKAVTGAGEVPLADITRLQQETGNAARTLRELSYQLHPTALEHAGLAAALEMKCEEVRQVTGLSLRVVRDGEVPRLPDDLALCVYRVAQEAITNAVRHSGARSIEVALGVQDLTLQLAVSDDGRGFEPDAAGHRKGLGLRSITERVRAYGGHMTIESAPASGTVLRAAIPLKTDDHA